MSYNKLKFSSLGKNNIIPESPDPKILDKVINPKKKSKYCVRFTCPEFTSICPVTSQPDFANLIIDYVPSKYIVEITPSGLYLSKNSILFHSYLFVISKDVSS